MMYLKYSQPYCPYCYSKLHTPTEFYCLKCGKVTSAAAKNLLQIDYRGLPVCDCGNGPMFIKCSNEECRAVNNIIPPTKATGIVVIAGMRSSGKSTFLLDVVNSQSSQTGVIVSPKSHALIDWREKGIKSMKDSIGLDANDPRDNNFSSVVGMQTLGGSTELCLSLTDRPGEETQDINKMLGLNYLYCADYIILLLDLLNIPGVKSELQGKGVAFSEEAEQTSNETAIDSIIGAISTQRGKKGRKVPMMIGISKWDYVEKADLCPPGFSIGCEGTDLSSVLNAKRKFDKKQWNSNSKAIRNFLLMHNEGEVVNKAEQYFKNVSYFAFSNFGTAPEVNKGIVTFPIHTPRHIMDPFYCILHDYNMI